MSDAPDASVPSPEGEPCVDPTQCDHLLLRPSPEVQGTDMDGETVLLNLSTGRYYSLNQVGSVIWSLCTGAHTLRDIQTMLCDRFEVPPERALDDLVVLVNQLLQEGLLHQESKG